MSFGQNVDLCLDENGNIIPTFKGIPLPQGLMGKVSYSSTLSGSINRSIYSKLSDITSVTDFSGTDLTGSVNSNNGFVSAINSGEDLQNPTGKYTLTQSLNLPGVTIHSAGRSTIYTNSNSSYGFALQTDTDIDGGSFVTPVAGGPTFSYESNALRATIRNVKITNNATSNGTAINITQNGIKNAKIALSSISGVGYGVLVNSGTGVTIDGVVIIGNDIGTNYDAVETNAPGSTQMNVVVSGNLLRALEQVPGHIGGFGFGTAAGVNQSITGNVIGQSGWEAIHVEDAQRNNVFVGNAAMMVGGDGVQQGQLNNGQGTTFVGNAFESASSAAGTYGFNHVFNGNGGIPGTIVIGNRFKSFPVGILGSSVDGIYTNNVADNCSTAAVESNGGGWMYGINFARSSPTLVKTLQSTVIGGIVTDSSPTTILDTSSHTAGTMGTTIKDEICFRGLSASVPGSTGGITTAINLFTLPKLLRGRIIVRATNQANAAGWVYASADLTWDGTTLTVANNLTKSNGTFANATPFFINSTGNLAIEMYSSNNGALTFLFDVIFKGEFYN